MSFFLDWLINVLQLLAVLTGVVTWAYGAGRRVDIWLQRRAWLGALRRYREGKGPAAASEALASLPGVLGSGSRIPHFGGSNNNGTKASAAPCGNRHSSRRDASAPRAQGKKGGRSA